MQQTIQFNETRKIRGFSAGSTSYAFPQIPFPKTKLKSDRNDLNQNKILKETKTQNFNEMITILDKTGTKTYIHTYQCSVDFYTKQFDKINTIFNYGGFQPPQHKLANNKKWK